MGRNSDVQRTTKGNDVSGVAGRAPRYDKRRGGRVNLLSLLLRGRWRNASGVALVLLGVAAVAAVILLLVALIAFVVQRSNESLDVVLTPAVTPVMGQTAVVTVSPTVTVTLSAAPTATATVVPTPTEEPALSVGVYVKVTGTGALGLRLREKPGLDAETTDVATERTTLKVMAGPEKVDDIEWWQLESAAGKSGWAAGDFLVVTEAPPGGFE